MRDIPTVLRRVGPWRFAKRVYGQMSEDHLTTWASSMAYAWLFAIFPFFIFLLTLLPYLPAEAKDNAQTQIHDALFEYLPKPAAEEVWKNVVDVLARPREGLLTVGIGLALWAASGGMAATMRALDRCYELPTSRPFYKERPAAILLTIIEVVLILSVLLLLPVSTQLIKYLMRIELISRPLALLLNVARWGLALLFMFSVVSALYYFGIHVRQRFRLLSPGAVFTVFTWIALGLLLRWYIERVGASYNKTYGTVGGVAIMLIVFYLDALVLLIGAEINSEIDFEVLGVERGSRDFRRPVGT